MKIGEIFKVTSGGTPSRKRQDYFIDGTIPWVKTGDLKGKYVKGASEFITEEALKNSSAKIFPKNTVLLAMYGATIGACSILPFEAATNQACGAILPSEKCDPNYLFYYLSSIKSDLIKRGVGGAQPNISGSIIKKVEIPLPPLPEQKKIAAILDAADAYRQQTKALIGKYEELGQSLFLEMFGDPVRNEMGWEKVRLQKIIINIIGGLSLGGEERRLNKGEKAVLKISSVTKGYFRSDQYKVVDAIPESKKLIYPQKGDLLFSRANTREMVGAVAIVDKNYDNLFLPDKLWRLDFEETKADNFYVKFLLQHDGFRNNLRKVATGTSGSMLNISKAKLRQLLIPLPPIILQNQFASRIQAIESQKAQAEASLGQAEALFGSLLQGAFRGEL